MEPSPLSIFEAVIKVIEDRVPFGRQLVTLTSVLMLAAVLVFTVEYLVTALAPPLIWTVTLIRTRTVPPLPQVARIGEHISVAVFAILAAYFWFVGRFLGKTVTAQLDTVLHLTEDILKQVQQRAQAMRDSSARIQEVAAQIKDRKPPSS